MFNNYLHRLSGVSELNKKELNELRCHERKMQRQVELIKSALNELGCEEAPPGCDLIIEQQTVASENGSANQVGVSTTFNTCIT